METRGPKLASKQGISLISIVVLSLSLILAWPALGAGTRGGGQRVAISLAVWVDVAATSVAVAKPD